MGSGCLLKVELTGLWADGMGAWEQSEGCGALLAVGVVTCEEREDHGRCRVRTSTKGWGELGPGKFVELLEGQPGTCRVRLSALGGRGLG